MAAALSSITVKLEDDSNTFHIGTMPVQCPPTQAQLNSATATSCLPSTDERSRGTHSLKFESEEQAVSASPSYEPSFMKRDRAARQGTTTPLSSTAEGAVFTSPYSTPAPYRRPSDSSKPISFRNLTALMGFMRESLQTMPVEERSETTAIARKLLEDALAGFEQLGRQTSCHHHSPVIAPIELSSASHDQHSRNDAPIISSMGQSCTHRPLPSVSQSRHCCPGDDQASVCGSPSHPSGSFLDLYGSSIVHCTSHTSLQPTFIDDVDTASVRHADGITSSSQTRASCAKNYQPDLSGSCAAAPSTEERAACHSPSEDAAQPCSPVSSEATHPTIPSTNLPKSHVFLEDIMDAQLMYPPTPSVQEAKLLEPPAATPPNPPDPESATDVETAQDHSCSPLDDRAVTSCPLVGTTILVASDIGPPPPFAERLSGRIHTPGILTQSPKSELDMEEMAAVVQSAVHLRDPQCPDPTTHAMPDDHIPQKRDWQRKPPTLLSRLGPRQDISTDTIPTPVPGPSLRERLWVQFSPPVLDADVAVHSHVIESRGMKRDRDEDPCDLLPARHSKLWGDRITRGHEAQTAASPRYHRRSKFTKSIHFANASPK